MINLANIPQPMTTEEKKELLENWNENSWKVLAERNIRLAILISRKFYNSGIDEEELFSIAQFGLVKAAKKFRPDNGNEFSTFASTVITNDILMQIRKNKRMPNLMFSLNDPMVIGHDGDTCEFGELIACTKNPFEEIEERQFLEYIRNIMKNEDEKYRQILLLSFDGFKQKDISSMIGFTQAHVSRILSKYKNKCLKYTEQR